MHTKHSFRFMHLFTAFRSCAKLIVHFLCVCLQEYTGPGGAEVEVEKPAKEEYNIAKWIKKNVPTKKTKFLNHHVEYFTGKIFFLDSFFFELDFNLYAI